ncbi:MAG TPA: hypothetical protein VGE07_29625 [Herpetosiphonaceae bacterium]
MFTPDDYGQQLAGYLARPLLPCEYWMFDMDMNEDVRLDVARGSTAAFASGLHFLINTLRFQQAFDGGPGAAPADALFARYQEAIVYRPLTMEGWVGLVTRQLRRLIHPPALPVAPAYALSFVAALYIDVDGYTDTVLAEVGGQYVAVTVTPD